MHISFYCLLTATSHPSSMHFVFCSLLSLFTMVQSLRCKQWNWAIWEVSLVWKEGMVKYLKGMSSGLMETVKHSILRWFGHLERMNENGWQEGYTIVKYCIWQLIRCTFFYSTVHVTWKIPMDLPKWRYVVSLQVSSNWNQPLKWCRLSTYLLHVYLKTNYVILSVCCEKNYAYVFGYIYLG